MLTSLPWPNRPYNLQNPIFFKCESGKLCTGILNLADIKAQKKQQNLPIIKWTTLQMVSHVSCIPKTPVVNVFKCFAEETAL